jgi:hypothetical protein
VTAKEKPRRAQGGYGAAAGLSVDMPPLAPMIAKSA